MIKSISSHGRYLQVNGGSNIYPYISPGAANSGQLRFNVTSNHLEIWDGVSWKEITNNYTSVGLTSEAEELLDWARAKRFEDQKLNKLLEEHPPLKDVYEKFQIVLALVNKDTNA